MRFELLHPADQLVMIMDRIYHYGMTTTSGGNLSIMDSNGDIWITPSGIDKGSLTRNDMICVKPDGTHDVTTNVSVLTSLCRAHGLVPNGKFQVVDGFAVYPKEVFCPVDFDTEQLHRTKKTAAIHWFASSWKTEEERRELEAERARLHYEKVSAARYAFFTKLLGEKTYRKLKARFWKR